VATANLDAAGVNNNSDNAMDHDSYNSDDVRTEVDSDASYGSSASCQHEKQKLVDVSVSVPNVEKLPNKKKDYLIWKPRKNRRGYDDESADKPAKKRKLSS
jgi:hypothetical protein